MAIALDVEKQRLEFGSSWTFPFKYDDTAFYRKQVIRLHGNVDGAPQSMRAVDVVALHARTGLLLLEAKDFRGHRIANKMRVKDGEVALEVALKVRDSVAALVGAARKAENEFPSDALVRALAKGSNVSVVLWLEDDLQMDERRAKQQMSVTNSVLKQKLAWLNVKTFVLSSRVQNKVSDLSVTNRPGAGQS